MGEESIKETQQDAEEVVSDAYADRIESKRPEAEERRALLEQHHGHLIRRTTSQVSETDVIDESGGGAIAMNKTAEVSDTYCFTCEEWVGLSGVELTGTPRSKDDAFYLGGEPEGVSEARERVTGAIADAAGQVMDHHPEVETVDEAVQFVIDTASETEFVEGDDAK